MLNKNNNKRKYKSYRLPFGLNAREFCHKDLKNQKIFPTQIFIRVMRKYLMITGCLDCWFCQN